MLVLCSYRRSMHTISKWKTEMIITSLRGTYVIICRYLSSVFFKKVYCWTIRIFSNIKYYTCIDLIIQNIPWEPYTFNIQRQKRGWPGTCLTSATRCCREYFSQWERKFHSKVCCHRLDFLRQRQIAVVRQGSGCRWLVPTFSSLFTGWKKKRSGGEPTKIVANVITFEM